MRALALSLIAFPLLLTAPASAQKPTMTGFCFTDVGAATVYFSRLYESGLNADVLGNYDGYINSRAFLAYVKARYNYRSGSNYPSTCSYRPLHDAAEVIRGGLMGTVQRENRKAVEVDWSPPIDSAEAAASFTVVPKPGRARPGPKMEHGYCVSMVNPGPQYVSAVFEPPQPVALYQWVQGFMKYLAAKYQYKGEVYCTNENIEVAGEIIQAYIDGAKAADRKVVATGWKFEGAAPAGAATPKPDDDPEPAKPGTPAPTPPAPRAAAQKDAAMARTYCLKDKLMSRLFNCAKVEEAVAAYRTEHPLLAGEPMEVVFSGERVNCKTCLVNDQVSAWARRQALNANLKPAVANCVASRFLAGLTSRPYFEQVKEQYDMALALCK